MALKNLNFATIRKDSENIIWSDYDSYLETYPEFIQYFRNIDRIERHHLIISSHFIYGWMPTILNIDLKSINEVLRLLNEVKSGKLLTVEELMILKKCINNSLVGLSKLLHFINPRSYAIWDSRIFRYLTEKKSSYGIDNPNTYLEYLNGIKSMSEHQDYRILHNFIESKFEYKIEPMRAIEIVMFETDRKRNQ